MELTRLRRYQGLIINEAGDTPFKAHTANRFFQPITNHHTQLDHRHFQPGFLPHGAPPVGDNVIAATTIDRLLHPAHELTLDNASYRVRGYTTDEGSDFTGRSRGKTPFGIDTGQQLRKRSSWSPYNHRLRCCKHEAGVGAGARAVDLVLAVDR